MSKRISTPVHPGRLDHFPLPIHRQIDGFETTYFDEGEGPTVCFIHGLGGNMTHFQYVAPALAKEFRVIGLDLPGFGVTPRPKGKYTYDVMARAVWSLLNQRSAERVILVGHSFGGAVASLMALNEPSRVRGLVLINPAGYQTFPTWMRRGAPLALHPSVLTPLLFLGSGWIVGQVCRKSTEAVESFRRSAIQLRGGARFLADLTHATYALADDLVERNFIKDAHKIEQPCHVVWGEEDRLLSAAAGIEAVQQMPHVRVTLLPGVGHMPVFEDPGSVIEAIIDVHGRACRHGAPNSEWDFSGTTFATGHYSEISPS